MEVCHAEYPVSMPDLMTAFESDTDPTTTPDAVKCHMKCMLDKGGVYTNESLDKKSFIQSVSNIPMLKVYLESATKAIDACSAENVKKDCESAFKFMKCMHTEIHKNL